MTEALPIGRLEDQHLEFKASAVLDDPFQIGREVVAMLNADVGEVWIGIGEKEGKAISVQDVPDAQARRERLQEHLVDTIHPRPSHREVLVEVFPYQGGECLVARVRPNRERQPYAQIKKGGQFYWKRIAAIIRPMGPAEVLQWARGNAVPAAPDTLLEMQRRLAEERFKGFWIGIAPEEPLDVRQDRNGLEEWNRDPSRLGMRVPGCNCIDPWAQVESLQGNAGGWSIRQGSAIRTSLSPAGVIELRVAFSALEHGVRGTINPIALAEFTQSLFRFTASVYGQVETPSPLVRVSAAIFGAAELPLRPFSPAVPAFNHEYPGNPHRRFEAGNDLLFEKPLEFEWNEVLERPLECGLRLLRQVYRIYGYEEAEMPAELDRRTGELKI